MKIKVLLVAAATTLLVVGAAEAGCPEIKQDCWNSYRKDLAACGKIIDGNGQRCRKDAADKRDHCIKASGC